jgi:hypothetical protein
VNRFTKHSERLVHGWMVDSEVDTGSHT